jgi:hypothetical protein
MESVQALPWRNQTCPGMPHQYVHTNKLTDVELLAYHVVEVMLTAKNDKTYRAFFRGYPSPNRYWDAPDGQRKLVDSPDDQPVLAQERRAAPPRRPRRQGDRGLGRRHLRADQ